MSAIDDKVDNLITWHTPQSPKKSWKCEEILFHISGPECDAGGFKVPIHRKSLVFIEIEQTQRVCTREDDWELLELGRHQACCRSTRNSTCPLIPLDCAYFQFN